MNCKLQTNKLLQPEGWSIIQVYMSLAGEACIRLAENFDIYAEDEARRI